MDKQAHLEYSHLEYTQQLQSTWKKILTNHIFVDDSGGEKIIIKYQSHVSLPHVTGAPDSGSGSDIAASSMAWVSRVQKGHMLEEDVFLFWPLFIDHTLNTLLYYNKQGSCILSPCRFLP